MICDVRICFSFQQVLQGGETNTHWSAERTNLIHKRVTLQATTGSRRVKGDIWRSDMCLKFFIKRLSLLNCTIRPSPCSPEPLFQNEVKCSVFDMEIIFHFRANKTHFHKKGCALESFWNSDVAYSTSSEDRRKDRRKSEFHHT